MARRMLAWALVTPVAAAGILAAHALAYRLTGTAPGSLHDYLGHAPQLVGVLASVGLVGLALSERSIGRPPAWAYALVAPLGFTCQEHVERLVHTGDLPWLLTTPAFLVGLALQVPVALLCVLVARRVEGSLRGVRRSRPASVGEVWLPLPDAPTSWPRIVRLPRPRGRGPPLLLSS
jgi:hypothetical protein